MGRSENNLLLETILYVFLIYNLYGGILYFSDSSYYYRASLVAQAVKNLPAVQETQVQSLGL